MYYNKEIQTDSITIITLRNQGYFANNLSIVFALVDRKEWLVRQLKLKNYFDDTLLEGLSRAHSTFATRTLANWSKSQDEKSSTFPPLEQQVQQTVLHFDKAIELYKQLAKRDPEYETKIVAFSTPFKEYANKNFLIGVYQPLKDSPLYNQTLHDLVTAYQNNVLTINNQSVRGYPVKNVFIPANRRQLGYTETDTTFTDSIAFKLKSYLPMHELLMMDVIQENFNKRPVCFALSQPDYFTGYFEKKGITYQLVPVKSASQLINSQRTVQQLETYVKEHYIPPFNGFKKYFVEYSFYLEHHMALYLTLINYYLEGKDITLANNLVKQCFLPFGNQLPYVYHVVSVVSTLYKSNNAALADQLAAVYIQTTVADNANKSIIRIQNNFLALGNLKELEKVMHTYNRNTTAIMKAISIFREYERAHDPNL